MPVSPTYPGIYIQEIPSGVTTITGVATSIAMFIGASTEGPMNVPVECLNYSTFKNTFGEDTSSGMLPLYVQLFFLNGGTTCYVMRIAQGAGQSVVTLNNEDGANTLVLTAKNFGVAGESVRALVTYAGAQPEATFNLEVFQWTVDSTGRQVQTGDEVWRNLSMDPNSPNYAPTFISQNSQLVNATDLNPAPGGLWGFSLAARPVADADWGGILGAAVSTNRFQISVSGSPYIDVDLSTLAPANPPNNLTGQIATAIEAAFTNKGYAGVTVDVSFLAAAAGNRLRISRTAGTNGDVLIRPGTKSGAQGDLTTTLMLGTGQGGLEVGAFASRRPAPTGITFRVSLQNNFTKFGDLASQDVTQVTLDAVKASGTFTAINIPLNLNTTGNGVDPLYKDANGKSDGIREKLGIIASIINQFTPPAGQSWPWTAQTNGNYRLSILPTSIVGDNFLSGNFALIPAVVGSYFTNNVRYYSVGAGGNSIGNQVSAAAPATDGTAPLAADYDAAYLVIDKEVDLFNLMVLPPAAGSPASVQSLYGDASVFCQQRRAFLIMDPPDAWQDAQTAATQVATLQVGLVKDYSALFFPRITVNNGGLATNIGAAGAMAGVFARIDGNRGVWKAPAGTEADLRGITGLEKRYSNAENGILNPRAVNTIRIFPSGVVSWGGRTMYGDDNTPNDYKYIPVRRLALYLEESLYRGLQTVVFEPNDEPLWSHIRLTVGSFMHDLFRQGAFQGSTPQDAYFVKCDSETTTSTDQDNGIVNVWVGFAALKPAEFVILYIQQMAGQTQV